MQGILLKIIFLLSFAIAEVTAISIFARLVRSDFSLKIDQIFGRWLNFSSIKVFPDFFVPD